MLEMPLPHSLYPQKLKDINIKVVRSIEEVDILSKEGLNIKTYAVTAEFIHKF